MFKLSRQNLIIAFLWGGVFLLTFFCLGSCEPKYNEICAIPVVSPGRTKMVFKVCYQKQEGMPLVYQEKAVYVLDLNEGKLSTVDLDGCEDLAGLSWQVVEGMLRLSVLRLSTNCSEIHTFAVEKNGLTTTMTHNLPNNIIVPKISWSPNGAILAAYVKKPKEDGAYLGISFDKGANIDITDIEIRYGNIVWINNDELYLQNGSEIFKVKLEKEKAAIVRIIASADGIYLMESLNGRVIYTKGEEIYYGDKLLYTCEQEIGMVDADGIYIGFKAGDYLLVLDEQGNLISEKKIGKNRAFVGISSKDKYVYLVKDKHVIERYNFDGSCDISVVYDIRY